MEATEVMKRLQAPFLPDEIEWRVGSTNGDKSKGIALAYVTNRAIQNRLDDVFGPFGWKNEFREWRGNSQLCGISIKVGEEWITKWDGADDSNMEAVKGGLSDAMKRAAYQWGIGRYLYKLENMWVEILPAGKSFRLKYTPPLPAWALPEGFTPEPQQTQPTHIDPDPAPAPSEAPQGNSGQPPKTATPITSKQVYGLMNSMKWQFDDLSRFATEWFGKEIRNLKNQLKTPEEWTSLYVALKYYHENGQMPQKAG